MLKRTIEEINLLNKDNIDFVLTRHVGGMKSPDDLDILVKDKDFGKIQKVLTNGEYMVSSHDRALGGRVEGAQVNLVKKGRTKIDLHRDFTWRKTRYLDLDLVWNKRNKIKIDDVEYYVPEREVDVFLVLINILFEKTYITESDFKNIGKDVNGVFSSKRLLDQTERYGWKKTWKKFARWYDENNPDSSSIFPMFLPVSLVIYSYFEKLKHDKKLDFMSFFYYIFFRTRYILNKTLPYE